MNRCPDCGVELDASSPGGLCPACLIACGLESQLIICSGGEVRRPEATGADIEDDRFEGQPGDEA